jgi:hypothetical protein
MIKWLVDWLIARAKRTPYMHLPGYMNRWWLIPYGRGPAVRIHEILRSDLPRSPDRPTDFHDHPWPYLTIILRGGYTEVTPVYDRSGLYLGEKRKWYKPGSVLFRRARSWHYLETPEGQTATTLFITFGYARKWGFLLKPDHKMRYDEYFTTFPKDRRP